ncbi:MAG: pyruvate kinase [Leptolinea sp.]|jgi:pyruvate kinase|nr:pyruvate kinase [Leptolinea sp.]
MNSRKAKIVATIGPACDTLEKLKELLLAGVDVVRLNFSHGTHEDHHRRIGMVRQISQEIKKPISILQDLQGPKMRVGLLPDAGIDLVAGQSVLLTSKAGALSEGIDHVIPMEVPELARSVHSGSRILLDDGRLELQVTAIKSDSVQSTVKLGGRLTSHKGVNLPGADILIPGFTEKDKEDLTFGLQEEVDYVAISFVRSANDIKIVRKAIFDINPARTDTRIIAKLERPEAIDDLEAILDASDGVMVARGDLGVETSPQTVPIMQKLIIEAATKKSRQVITATQMLESMMHNPRPTRAEASDVANAIFDGSDAVMLSGETASGDYPVDAVKMMDAIIQEAEAHNAEWGHCHPIPDPLSLQDDSYSLARAAKELAQDTDVTCIAVFTRGGHTARVMSKVRPDVPVLAFTPDKRTYQRLGLYWGITPFLVPFASTVESMIQTVENAIIESSLMKAGQQVILISGFPVGKNLPPNFVLLHTLGRNK